MTFPQASVGAGVQTSAKSLFITLRKSLHETDLAPMGLAMLHLYG
jgi:hypothetical protein